MPPDHALVCHGDIESGCAGLCLCMSEKSLLPPAGQFFVPPVERTPVVAAPMRAELFNMLISAAYDTVALNARAQEFARREQLCDNKEREIDDREAKARFMAIMAQASEYSQSSHRFPQNEQYVSIFACSAGIIGTYDLMSNGL